MIKGVRIAIALIVAGGIVFGAFYLAQKSNDSSIESAVAVKTSDSKEPFEEVDANNNGISDWKEELSKRAIEQVTINSEVEFGFSTSTYEPPDTFTGKFSVAFMNDYLEGKMEGQDFENSEAFIDQAVSAINANVQSKTYTRADLNIISSNRDILRDYGNELILIINNNSHEGENELVIFQDAILKNDPNRLTDLAAIERAYEQIIAGILTLDVPDEVALQHVALLNACEAVRTDIDAMQYAFDDPLYALARFNVYLKDAEDLYNALKNIASVLNRYDITYTNEEPGAFFFMFDSAI